VKVHSYLFYFIVGTNSAGTWLFEKLARDLIAREITWG